MEKPANDSTEQTEMLRIKSDILSVKSVSTQTNNIQNQLYK
jgi:hypothetical protein